jgi:hypothetical protein
MKQKADFRITDSPPQIRRGRGWLISSGAKRRVGLKWNTFSGRKFRASLFRIL